MRQTQNKELDARITAFLDKKMAQFPELDTPAVTKNPKTHSVTSTFSNITALLKPFHIG
ncbi:MAG TPA: hypothetical protein VLA88_00900 [Candidatus Saccharimonadales bacterium]|nr:hypothetical protein [Candidatus Saccharimonadales bacterium]